MADDKTAPALGPDDYKMLYEMAISSDEATRKRGHALAGKLTPDEAHQFFEFQHALHPSDELHRQDNSLLGMPPELAVAGGIGVARTIAGAGAGLLPKATAVAKTIALPAVKEEMTRRTLESFGVPRPIAAVIGGLVAGYGMKSAGEAGTVGEAVDAAALRAKAAQTLAKTPAEITDAAIQSGRTQGAATAAAAPSIAAAPSAAIPAPPPAVDMAGQPSAVAHGAVAERAAATVKPVSTAIAESSIWNAAAKANIESLSVKNMRAAAALVQQGATPEAALSRVMGTVDNPAAELARRLGTKTDAEVAADFRMRYEKGQKSLSGYAKK